MEDVVIINKVLIECGLVRLIFFRIYEVEEKCYFGG